jgi:hypothetical protein
VNVRGDGANVAVGLAVGGGVLVAVDGAGVAVAVSAVGAAVEAEAQAERKSVAASSAAAPCGSIMPGF